MSMAYPESNNGSNGANARHFWNFLPSPVRITGRRREPMAGATFPQWRTDLVINRRNKSGLIGSSA
jgi:hypothetical protein